MSPRKQTFIQGAMILLAAGLLNRVLGFLPRIALPRMIGAEGVGLVQLVYPFTIVLLTVIAGGLPLAVAKLVAEADSRGSEREVRRIMRSAMSIAVAVSVTASVVCLVLADTISSRIMTDTRVHAAFLTMIPVLPLVGISSVWRGYFQGKMNMIPTAVSQTLETVVRIAGTLLGAATLLPFGLEAAAAGAVAGMVAGEAAALLVLYWQIKKDRDRFPLRNDAPKDKPEKSYVKPLLAIALPVTGSKLIGSLSYLFESILTARSLALAGLTAAAATAQYGALQGMVIPLLLLPGALTYSLAVSLVPSLSEAAARGDWATIHLRLHQSMRLAVVTGAPFAVLLGMLAEPLCDLLYGNHDMARMLQWLAPIAVLLYMQAPLQAALQALDRPGMALFNTFAGSAVKLTLIVQLASDRSFGIYGAIIAIAVNIALVTLLHWISVARLTGLRLRPLDFVKVAVSVTIMAAIAMWIWNGDWLPGYGLDLIAAGLFSTVAYLLLLVASRLIDRHDAARVPLFGRFFR